jgi:maltose/moltooligosaccharide transporter
MNASIARPRLSFLQIWNMSFGFLGIQFGFALQNANTSRIFGALGAEPNDLAMYWLAAPVTGLLVQPIIGFYSDRTWHRRWGRRRPYFTLGAILASLALLMMPNSSLLWMAVGTLWIMDASINISMEPFRAFVGDLLPPEQRTAGFAMQSFFIGTGAVVASVLPWVLTNVFDVNNKPMGDSAIADSVKYSFYIGAVVLFTTVMWTVFSTNEYPPEEGQQEKLRNRSNRKLDDEGKYKRLFLRTGSLLFILGTLIAFFIQYFDSEKELYILAFGLGVFGLIFFLAAGYIGMGKSYLGMVHMVKDFLVMPRTMVQLAFVQFFSWFALFAMWIYTTPVVTKYVFGSTDPKSQAYNDGADWVNILFGAYNLVAALTAILLPVLARYTSRRVTHLIALCCGGAGLISFLFVRDPNMLILSMVGVGIAWASILSIPYAMLSSSLPSEKMGYYMGVFNFFIVIPQIIAGTVLGFMLNHLFDGETMYILVAGGVSMVIAGLLNLRVDDLDEVTIKNS